MTISQHGTSVLFTSHPKDGLLVNLYILHNRRAPFKPKKLSVPFLYPGVPAGLTPFRGLVPLGRRNLVPILPPAYPLGGGWNHWRTKINKTRKHNTRQKIKGWATRTPPKNPGWTQLFMKSKKFMFLIRHPSCYSYSKFR